MFQRLVIACVDEVVGMSTVHAKLPNEDMTTSENGHALVQSTDSSVVPSCELVALIDT